MDILVPGLKGLLPARVKRAIRDSAGVPSMASRLQNLRRAGFHCTGAVDGGAFAGEWTTLCQQVFGCPVIAVEPMPREALSRLVAASSDVSLLKFALSDKAAESATFLEQGSNSRFPDAGSLAVAGNKLTKVATRRLDDLLARQPGTPNLLKLDLQGAELKALGGATGCLPQFEVVICEVSVIPIGDVPDFAQMMDWFQRHDYRLYDFLPAYYRPLDGALWQADAFFVRQSSPLVSSTQWG